MKKNKKGFVLVELLAAVAVLIVSFSITSVSANEINKQLNQNKAVSTARDIFIEAQYNLTALKSSGKLDLLNNNSGTLDEVGQDPKLSYITSDHENSDNFVNDEEYGGKYIIEFSPETGLVSGVWWESDDELDNFNDFFTAQNYKKFDNANNSELIEFAEDNGYNIAHYDNEIDTNNNKKENKKIEDPKPNPKPDPVPDEPDPEDPDPTYEEHAGFVYYEVYTDGTYGFYYIEDFGSDVSHNNSLSETKGIVGDGYGLIIDDDAKCDRACVYFKDIKEYFYTNSCSNPVDLEAQTFYPLPLSWVEHQFKNRSKFYSELHFSFGTESNLTAPNGGNNGYLVETCMLLAKNGVGERRNNGHNFPENIIRTARQLYNLSLYYPEYASIKKNNETLTYMQERDIDYTQYDWANYTTCGSNTVPAQRPIGCGYKKNDGVIFRYVSSDNTNKVITGIQIVEENGYIGLFARLVASDNNGKNDCAYVENITLDFSKGSLAKASSSTKYRGAIAGCVESDTLIKNCVCNGEKIYGVLEETSSNGKGKNKS